MSIKDPQNPQQDPYEERLKRFIQRLQDMDIIVKPEAKKIPFNTQAYGKKSVAEIIPIGISMYYHDPNWSNEATLDNYINYAFMHNAIQIGEGMFTKYKRAQEKIEQLEKENDGLRRKLAKSEEKLAEWEKEYGVVFGKHFQGDVTP